jgi:hypothetical protein
MPHYCAHKLEISLCGRIRGKFWPQSPAVYDRVKRHILSARRIQRESVLSVRQITVICHFLPVSCVFLSWCWHYPNYQNSRSVQIRVAKNCVPDPDPEDPDFFGPPWSGSSYECGSFINKQKLKETLFSTVLCFFTLRLFIFEEWCRCTFEKK